MPQNIVHVAESTVGRRYAGWFIRNTEGAERAYDSLHAMPVPGPKPVVVAPPAESVAPVAAVQKTVAFAAGTVVSKA